MASVNPQEVLQRISWALEQAGIPYMFTGSLASSYHGMPRASQDIDIVIAPIAAQLRTLRESLPPTEYYFDLDDALDAFRRGKQFNIIDLTTGWKLDMIIRKSRPFSHMEFDRRLQTELDGVPLFIVSAEDIILAKLEWAKLGQSNRQIEDAAGVLRIRRNDLDRNYIEHWVKDLSIESEWARAVELAGE